MAGEGENIEGANEGAPAQLHAQLIETFKRFPKNFEFDDLVDKYIAENPDADANAAQRIEHREGSEYVEKLLAKIKQLVEKAPVTTHMKRYIASQLQAASLAGIDLDDEELTNNMYFFLDLQQPGSGGIFDSSRARRFERIAMAREAQSGVLFQAILDRVTDGSPSLSRDDSIIGRDLQAWRTEYEAIYEDKL